MKILLFIILSIFIRFSHAQNLSHEYLTNLEDEELLSLFNRYRGDSTQAERVARIYLNRARREGDTIKMARGYDRLARIFHFKKNLGFCDSIINLTSDLKNKTYPALGYMIKSFEYSKKGDLVNSFKNILIVYNLSIQNDNISHELYALNALIKSKSYWGNSREALDLQNHRHELLQRPDIHDLLIGSSRIGYQEKTKELMAENEINSFLGFVICYLNLQDFKKSEMYIDSLRTKILEYRGYNRNKYIRWPAECLLELEFRRNNLKRYLEISDAMLPEQTQNRDLVSLFDNYGFRGTLLMRHGYKSEGINYLLKADSIYRMSRIPLLPYKRSFFEELLDHYTSEGSEFYQIKYLTELIKIDSIFKVNYQYFEPEQIKKFETPRLLKTKENIIAKLEYQNKKIRSKNWLIASAFGVSLILLGFYFNRQRVFRKRFNELLNRNEQKRVVNIERKEHNSDISSEVVSEILEQIHRFERQRQFLDKNITLQSLAKSFRTNSNYLSRIVNLKMEKNFSQYLHDLRIEYATKEILSDAKFRKYTIKAIAEECGYSNAESFSRAFYKKNGIYPSYYIKKLNKSIG